MLDAIGVARFTTQDIVNAIQAIVFDAGEPNRETLSLLDRPRRKADFMPETGKISPHTGLARLAGHIARTLFLLLEKEGYDVGKKARNGGRVSACIRRSGLLTLAAVSTKSGICGCRRTTKRAHQRRAE